MKTTTQTTEQQVLADLEGLALCSTEEANPTVQSVLAALIYADLFDYPLALDELVRYSAGMLVSRREVLTELELSTVLRAHVECTDGYYHLAGRTQLADLRKARGERSRKLWRRALMYGRLVSLMPFVRMVAVTGALSVHNIGAVPDIDLMIVAEEGRVWICRRALIACVRLARILGDDLCPNYVLASSKLGMDQRDFYTAHELAQMVPLSGIGVYKRLIRANAWAADYLPGALSVPEMGDDPAPAPRLQKLAERLLRHRVFSRWEHWEMERLRAKLRPQIGSAAEVVCTLQQCKGHTGLHRESVLSRFTTRAAELGVLDRLPELTRAGASQPAPQG